MILVSDSNGDLVAREDWEGDDLSFSIEPLQPNPALTTSDDSSRNELEMLVLYAQEVSNVH